MKKAFAAEKHGLFVLKKFSAKPKRGELEVGPQAQEDDGAVFESDFIFEEFHFDEFLTKFSFL